MIYGYARVSTDGQSVEAQVAALTAAGAVKVYRETASGAKTDRARLRQVLAALDQDDVLLVTRLDRLARSTLDLLHTLKTIADKGATFKSLVDTWADTTTPHGKLFTIILGGLAEFERELIKARTSEGRARAKARGVKLGRRPKLTPYQQREALERRASGEGVREIARSYNVSPPTISRLRPGTSASSPQRRRSTAPATALRKRQQASAPDDHAALLEAVATVGAGRSYVRIHRVREALGWPRTRFDRTLEEARHALTIELHGGDPSQCTREQRADSYSDPTGSLYLALSLR
jgi:DNA invertase Pin-like site-specific DNA recombinase